jgi:chemotaxis protein MotB
MSSDTSRSVTSGRGSTLLVASAVAAAIAVALFYFLLYQPRVKQLEEARREASLCVQERAALQARVSDLESMLDELRRESAGLADQIRLREERLAQAQSTQDEIVQKLEREIADGQIQVERMRGQLRVDMVDEILFDSGEAALSPAGREVLQKLASVLAGSDRQIRVQGHTDDVPIAGRLAQTYPTNWELSAARAVNVVRFLQDGANLDPTHLSASALSQYRPRVANDGPEGRQKNRRIEILLEPAAEEDAAGETAQPQQPQQP